MSIMLDTGVLTLNDIDGVIDLLFATYKHAYILDWMYDKKQIQEKMLANYATFIGVKCKGKLVALLVVFISAPSKMIAELGTLTVHHNYRDYNNGEVIRSLILFSRKFINELAYSGRVALLFSKPVAKHQLSQKLQILLGMSSVGIIYCTRPCERDLQLAYQGASADYNNMAFRRNNEVVAIYCYKSKINKLEVCLPDDDFSLLLSLFPVENVVLTNTRKNEAIITSDYSIEIEKRRSLAVLHLEQGALDVTILSNKLNELLAKDFRVIHVFLNVGEFSNLALINWLKQFGFIYSYFVPCYYNENGHAFVLQYLNRCTPVTTVKQFYDQKIQYLHSELASTFDLHC